MKYRSTLGSMTLLLGLGFFSSTSFAAGGIESMPDLAPLLIHHFECTATIIIDDPSASQEVNFTFAPSKAGQDQESKTVDLGADELVASANSQSLQLKWTRAGKLIAESQTMIQNSPTLAYVLIVSDPSNEENQVNISCDAVTFANLNGNH